VIIHYKEPFEQNKTQLKPQRLRLSIHHQDQKENVFAVIPSCGLKTSVACLPLIGVNLFLSLSTTDTVNGSDPATNSVITGVPLPAKEDFW
jgi:hypothetical protein